MSSRRYQTAYIIAKIVEVLSWVLLSVGVIAGLLLFSENTTIGIAVTIAAMVLGLILVFFAQLTLIFIDIENNTRQVADESLKTNAMLAETLGAISANVNRIARKEN